VNVERLSKQSTSVWHRLEQKQQTLLEPLLCTVLATAKPLDACALCGRVTAFRTGKTPSCASFKAGGVEQA